jgi:hypothetical protein
MEMMEYATRSRSTYCGWSDDGLSVIIRSPQEFMRHLVPRFFRGAKFQSFQRKLYRWGFRVVWHSHKQIVTFQEVIVYRQDAFQRGRIDLIRNMRSVTAEKTKTLGYRDTEDRCALSQHESCSRDSYWRSNNFISSQAASACSMNESFSLPDQVMGFASEPTVDDAMSCPPFQESNYIVYLPAPTTASSSASSAPYQLEALPIAELKTALLQDNANISSLLRQYNLEPDPI